MHPIPDILADLRAGKMIVLVDDETRENEGDLVCPASFIDPAKVNFMLKEARGMLCVALDPAICDRLHLEPQTRLNTSKRRTDFTVSVDAHERFGVTTGVSASDRATTIRLLADPSAQPHDFVRPGHIHPLRARPGGVLVRAGQTEGSVDLCRLAGLPPAAAIIEIMNDDGTMARRPDLEKFCQRHSLKMCSVADIIHYRLQRDRLVERVAESTLRTDTGTWRLLVYHSRVDPQPHLALVCGNDLGRLDPTGQPILCNQPVLVRMHSQNLLGDVFGDLDQPSGLTLHAAMQRIQQEGRGAVIYLRHAGMGRGILQLIQSLTLHPEEFDDTGERLRLGRTQYTPGLAPPSDIKDYGIGCQILRDLGIRRLRLLTNHPFTPTALAGFELTIDEFVPVDLPHPAS